jgi:3-keto-5-aminohexanoate cleavage enzyme
MAAGASIVHFHLPDLHLPPAAAVEQYLPVFRAWLEQDPDVLVQPTNGMGTTLEQRFGHQWLLNEAGALRLAFVDPGAMIMGYPLEDGTPADGYDYGFHYAEIAHALATATERRMGMALACFEPGFLRNVLTYWRLGRLGPGAYAKFYFGGDHGVLVRGKGVTFGLPPTLTGLAAYREILDLEDCPLPWFSAVVGGDLIRTPVARQTVLDGGHLRVGLEDQAGDRTPSNLELVQEAVALCHELGRPVATTRQTAEVLGLPALV